MAYRELTKEEEEYLEQGGRVFLISDQNEVVILKGNDVHIVPNLEGKPARYETRKMALETAEMIASLSEDVPMVDGVLEDPWYRPRPYIREDA